MLKRSMQLSSAMAKEMVSPALVTMLEDNFDVDLWVSRIPDHQFRPSTRLLTIVKSDIGFLQPSQVGQEGGGTAWLGEVVEEKWDASCVGLEVKLNDKMDEIEEDRLQDVISDRDRRRGEC